MRVQHNIAAMSSYRNYTRNTNALSKNLEKLSSGYKINRAGDAAAGLAISEKMRAQITGLNAAQKNVKDGISLVKTAEGAMQEIQDMLNRMDYLATQSANGTYDNEVDRLNLQKEVSALKDEINRIADSANFNGIKLLDGGGASTRAQITLPDVGRPIGDATVLKDGGVTPGETVFDVQLDTLAVNAKTGDKLTVQIGEDEFELTLAEKQYSAGDLATALKDAFDANGGTIDGQAFEATVNGTSVNFKQVNKPTSADDTVSAMMDVKISFEAAAGGGPVVLSNGIQTFEGDAAGGTISGTAGTAIKVKDEVGGAKAVYGLTLTGKGQSDLDGKKIDGVAISWDASDSSADLDSVMGTFVASYNADDTKDYTAAWDDTNGKLTLTAKEKGAVSTAPVTDIQDSGSTMTMTADTAGADPTTAAVTVDASTLTSDAIKTAADGTEGIADGKITIEKNASDKLELKIGDKVIGTSDETVDGSATAFNFKAADGTTALGKVTFSAAPAAADLSGAVETGLSYAVAGGDGNGEETPEVETVASSKLSVTGIDLADKTVTLTTQNLTDIGAEFAKLGSNTGKILISGEVEVDLSKVTDGLTGGTSTVEDLAQNMLEAAKAGADAWNKANPDKDYTYTNVRISKTAAGADGDIVAQAAGDGLYILMDKTPKTAPETDMPASVSGSYNAGTVKITQGAPEVGGATASTTIDLSSIFGGDIGDGSTLTIGKETYTFKLGDSFSFDAKGKTITLDKNATAADRIKQAGIGMSNMDNSAFTIGNENDTGKLTIDEAAGQTVYTSELYTKDGFEALFSANSISPKTGNGLTLQIGDTSDSYNQLKVSVGDMHTTALGIEGVDISNQAGASKAIQTIKDAINRVSSVRGDLGAIQNRLEHTGNNLSVMAENIQDAESTIRDTDVAEEMMSYVKNNILVQSAQAMLAQANQLPQGVLQLLG